MRLFLPPGICEWDFPNLLCRRIRVAIGTSKATNYRPFGLLSTTCDTDPPLAASTSPACEVAYQPGSQLVLHLIRHYIVDKVAVFFGFRSTGTNYGWPERRRRS